MQFGKFIKFRFFLPFSIMLIGVLSSLWFRSTIINAETQLIKNEVQAIANLFATELDSGMRSRIVALERMGQRWMSSGGTPKDDWEEDANNYFHDQPGFQAIEWVNSDFIVSWVFPLEGNESAIDLDLAFEQRRLEALEAARDGRDISVTRSIELVQGGKGFLVYVPLYLIENNEFDGFILGVYVIDNIFNEILSLNDDFQLEIYDEEIIIFSSYLEQEIREDLSAHAKENLFGITWNILVSPGNEWVGAQHSAVPNIFFLFGTIISFLMGTSYYFIAQSRFLRSELEEALVSENHLARTDALTGVFNRRGIEDILEREHSRNKREKNPFAIALFDLDGLKMINDEKGHNAGDEAIKSFAKMLTRAKRDYDWIGRYGGDEFLGIFPGASKQDISKLEARFKNELKKIRSNGHEFLDFSIGWTTSKRWKEETTKNMVERADKSLYKAKNLKKRTKSQLS
jgi:diguanylate cyclase (GGDEF)-like protein